MRLSGPVRYREAGTDAWIHGELKNISKSGLLFAGSGPLPEGSRIDIELEMPWEICGSIGRHVRCDAQIVRTRSGEKADLAARIFGYEFIDRPYLVGEAPRLERKFAVQPRCGKRSRQ